MPTPTTPITDVGVLLQPWSPEEAEATDTILLDAFGDHYRAIRAACVLINSNRLTRLVQGALAIYARTLPSASWQPPSRDDMPADEASDATLRLMKGLGLQDELLMLHIAVQGPPCKLLGLALLTLASRCDSRDLSLTN